MSKVKSSDHRRGRTGVPAGAVAAVTADKRIQEYKQISLIEERGPFSVISKKLSLLEDKDFSANLSKEQRQAFKHAVSFLVGETQSNQDSIHYLQNIRAKQIAAMPIDREQLIINKTQAIEQFDKIYAQKIQEFKEILKNCGIEEAGEKNPQKFGKIYNWYKNQNSVILQQEYLEQFLSLIYEKIPKLNPKGQKLKKEPQKAIIHPDPVEPILVQQAKEQKTARVIPVDRVIPTDTPLTFEPAVISMGSPVMIPVTTSLVKGQKIGEFRKKNQDKARDPNSGQGVLSDHGTVFTKTASRSISKPKISKEEAQESDIGNAEFQRSQYNVDIWDRLLTPCKIEDLPDLFDSEMYNLVLENIYKNQFFGDKEYKQETFKRNFESKLESLVKKVSFDLMPTGGSNADSSIMDAINKDGEQKITQAVDPKVKGKENYATTLMKESKSWKKPERPKIYVGAGFEYLEEIVGGKFQVRIIKIINPSLPLRVGDIVTSINDETLDAHGKIKELSRVEVGKDSLIANYKVKRGDNELGFDITRKIITSADAIKIAEVKETNEHIVAPVLLEDSSVSSASSSDILRGDASKTVKKLTKEQGTQTTFESFDKFCIYKLLAQSSAENFIITDDVLYGKDRASIIKGFREEILKTTKADGSFIKDGFSNILSQGSEENSYLTSSIAKIDEFAKIFTQTNRKLDFDSEESIVGFDKATEQDQEKQVLTSQTLKEDGEFDARAYEFEQRTDIQMPLPFSLWEQSKKLKTQEQIEAEEINMHGSRFYSLEDKDAFNNKMIVSKRKQPPVEEIDPSPSIHCKAIAETKHAELQDARRIKESDPKLSRNQKSLTKSGLEIKNGSSSSHTDSIIDSVITLGL